MLPTLQSIDEANRIHGVPRDLADLPTEPASDLTTPSSVSDVDKSPQSYVWRHSVDKELGSLLQASTFALVPA